MYTRTLLNKNHSADTKHRVRTADRALAFGDEPVRRTKWFQQHQHALCKIDLSSVAREVKEDENGDNFAVAHLKSAISPLFSVFANCFFLELRFNLLTEFVDRIKDFRYLCSVISVHVE